MCQVVAVGEALQKNERPVVVAQSVRYLCTLLCLLCLGSKIKNLQLSSFKYFLYLGHFDVTHDGGFRLILDDDAACVVQCSQ